MISVIEKKDNGVAILSMKNDFLEIVVSNYGCNIMKVFMSSKDGNVSDVVLGYQDIDDYGPGDDYLGAIVGRVANRIALGKFSINGEDYSVPINNGPNALHGGILGFSYQVFDYEMKEDTITFHYLSEDGEEGYPGNLDLYVDYQLLGHTLYVTYSATTDKDTLINLTNHSYFNLNGNKDSVYGHILQVNADQFAAVDVNGCTTGEIIDVTGTPFDFREAKTLGDMIHLEHPQLTLGNGYDHPFIFNTDNNQVSLFEPKSGRKLTVSTTLPQAQLYTANYLDSREGKNGLGNVARHAICIETQNMPDSIHLEVNPTTLLKKGSVYEEATSYTFEVIK
ncbi:aldose epimerase family protein [Tannockella kyphosi]|uniref:aldose epimerase family protein n=1 Tax=Tannockella kyphosi TaxID=2899121 RepID=UPI002012F193|nr:aldose epimerase family protein [Tannockella kyphosi]